MALPIVELSQIGQVRRHAADMARSARFDDTQAGKLALIITEAGTNLVKHAKSGEMVLHSYGGAIQMVALDRGPGMRNLGDFMRDGMSTTGTQGQGLGAIARVADQFDIHSVPGVGTTLVGIVRREESRRGLSSTPMIAGAVVVSKKGETVSGDSFAWHLKDGTGTFMVADGLGHGAAAADASEAAAEMFAENAGRELTEILERCHGAMRSTRGAAVAVARVLPHMRKVVFAGVGNIAGVVISPGSSRSMVSSNGIVGHEMPRVREFDYPWTENALLIMNSDGILSQWSLEAYAGLPRRHPALAASVLYRDFSRGRDDVCVLAASHWEPRG